MKRVSGYREAHLLYSPKSRRSAFPEAQFPFVLHAALNVVRAVATVHEAGQVVGDLNHGNLLVSNSATVVLIDCDSFQITTAGTIYPCIVGVPDFTPPELQGVSFARVRRTPQHDAFGLAVLVFKILFLGRHPFAGIFRGGNADMPIEQAIREFRFPYAAGSQEMLPPPNAAKLVDFPAEVGQLFRRAFERTATAGTRPAAGEWIGPLEGLAGSLKQCPANPSHQFFNKLTSCPWCRLEGEVGFSLFGVRVISDNAAGFDLALLWAKIEGLPLQPPATDAPNSAHFRRNATVDYRIPALVMTRRKMRLLGIGAIALAVTVVTIGGTPPVAAVFILAAGLFGMHRFWSKGSIGVPEFSEALAIAKASYTACFVEWDKIKDTPSDLRALKEQMVEARAQLTGLSGERASRLAALSAARRKRQLQQFLERYRIEDAAIPGVGPGRKALLLSFNVEDASDVNYSKLATIKGLGPKTITAIQAWRDNIEARFIFDPNRSVDTTDIRALDDELARKRANLRQVLTIGLVQMQRRVTEWQAQRSVSHKRLEEAAVVLAKAELNWQSLRGF